MAGGLILAGALWLAAIAIITGAAFLYFNGNQYLQHRKEMWQLKNGDE